jgi:diguanylate cyclase (GGDEF)-like protein
MGASILADWQVLALYLAFVYILLFSVLMILLGASALRAGNPVARYFLYAAIASAVGAALTALTVWGWLPYTVLGYRAVDVGTVIEALLLALALAEQFRRNQDERIRAEQLARIDPLTSLHNRRSFAEMVDPLWHNGLRKFRPMSLILLDLDDFKIINDSHGHAVGDLVLMQTAEALEYCARAGDVLSRWGGEEFILFMPETRLEEAVIVAERMRQKLASLQIDVDGQQLSCSASFGVAQYRQEMKGLEELIREADQRLYEAKAGGRNQVRALLG